MGRIRSAEEARKYYRENRTHLIKMARRRYWLKREEICAYNRRRTKLAVIKLRIETFEHYGKVCYCFGESNPLFLTLDHINSDGAAHRRAIGKVKTFGGWQFYAWLKKNNWPALPLQVACFNCNCGKHRNGGVCPHKS